MILGAMVIAKGRNELSVSAKIQTNNKPMIPPIIHRKALSNKNSYKW